MFAKIKSIKKVKQDYFYNVFVEQNANYLSGDIWNHNSGKDLLATLFFARRAYKLLCMGNPQKMFGMAASETIDLLNVALSGDQAKKVFFIRFSNIIKNAGLKAFTQFGFDPKKDVLKNQINFPKMIIAHSGHSEEQSQEGLNLYAAVMDEVSGFLPDKAQKLYDVISSSIHTRFPRIGKLLLLSYPRYQDDFIEVKYKEGLKDPQTFTAIGPTWEWNPKITRESLERDFQKNPEKAQAYYGCKPLESGIGFIRDLAKIDNVLDPNLRNPLDTLGRYESWFKPNPYTRNTYFAHIDLALGKIDEAGFQTSDVAGLAVGHKEASGIIIIDLMKRYLAPATGKEVEFATVRQDIIDLKNRGFDIKKITIDGWQCFTGDTQVCLLDGTVPTMEELSKKTKPYWVWSYDKDRGLVPGLAKPARVTGRGSPILKITLDNGKAIKCTPEHRFMLRSGEYKQAKDLTPDESLMPFYSRIDTKYLKGYLQVYNPLDQKYHFAHKLIVKSIYGLDKIEQGKIIHHKDYNKLNNDPDNLEIMLKILHCTLHAYNNKNFEKYWSETPREQLLKNCSEAGQKNKGIPKNTVHNQKVAKGVIKSWQVMTKEEYALRCKKIGEAIKLKWQDPEYLEKMRQRDLQVMLNHKVKSIEFYGYEDVYDIEVDKYHNFALQSGVIVHNSKDSMQILQSQGFTVELLAIDKGMEHWDTLKEVLLTGRLKTYPHFPGEIWGTQVDNVLTHELKHLVLVDGKKVDHLDISCFTGDTMIKLLDGRSLSFIDIIKEHNAGKELWTYSIDMDTKKIVPKKILNPRKTGEKAEVWEVELDNGEKIRCTPNHRFMIRNGEYKQAKDLVSGESLMPLYTKNSDKGLKGYEMLYCPFDNKYHTHWYMQGGKQSATKMNHKVVGVKFYGYEDVYDIEIEGTHNFPLASGVFVHNSKDVSDCVCGVVSSAIAFEEAGFSFKGL